MLDKLQNLIEAFLFWKNEPVSIKKIAEIFKLDISKTKEEISLLKESLSGRGIVLIEKDEEVMLGVSKDASDLIETMTKEELGKELSKAALETLSIVLYKGPIKRSEIDYIRGVNSQFILRHLEIRGLVEKKESPDDGRSYVYSPSFALFGHLGISNANELPEHDALRQAVENFEKSAQAENQEGQENKSEENVSSLEKTQ